MYIVKTDETGVKSLPAEEISLKKLNHLNSPLVFKIINALKGNELYPKAIAQVLDEHEQKIYYHIRNLEKAGIVIPTKTERIKGSFAKYYTLSKKGFFFSFSEFQRSPNALKLKEEASFFAPFIENGALNALIVTGSPDPHGPDKARARDGYYGIDLGLLIGTFLNFVQKPNVKLDTEVNPEELKQNLILIGGPIVNKITEQINDSLPVHFEKGDTLTIKSTITGNTYTGDELGIIVRTKNPLSPDHNVLLIAGKRHAGTKAAIVGILKHFNEVTKGNKYDESIMAKVVEGIDFDSDGIIDDAEFKE